MGLDALSPLPVPAVLEAIKKPPLLAPTIMGHSSSVPKNGVPFKASRQ